MVRQRQASRRRRARQRQLRLLATTAALALIAVVLVPGSLPARAVNAVLGLAGAASAEPSRADTARPGGALASPVDGPAASSPRPACTVGDVAAMHRSLDDWARTILDTEFTLGPAYAPADLVPIEEAGLPGNGLVRSFVVPDLRDLAAAARAAGIELSVASAYRSYKDQAATFASIERASGHSYALLSAARAGHSEHQLGTTIDFDGGDAWLAEHAWRFGFVASYPADRSPRFTCYKPEPWHYRYFGRQAAAAIVRSGLSPREWLWGQAS